MKKSIRLFLVSVLFSSGLTHATYDANMTGVLEGVYVYTAGDYIYFRLTNQPASHPGCDPTYFVISENVPESRRQMLLSRLLSAYAMKENVNIGYDSKGDCAHGYIRVHRAG